MNDSLSILRIVCPECSGLALLNRYPSKNSGIWSCSCGASGKCLHPAYHEEAITIDYMRNGQADQYETNVYVCDHCNCTVPFDIADPAIDHAEAEIDRQIMEALGK